MFDVLDDSSEVSMCSIANCGGGAPESLVLVWDIPQNKSKVEVQLTQR